MATRKQTKRVHESRFVAEVDVDLVLDDTGWSPYLMPDDACKLDDVRLALKRGDIESASRPGRVFELRPVAVQ